MNGNEWGIYEVGRWEEKGRYRRMNESADLLVQDYTTRHLFQFIKN